MITSYSPAGTGLRSRLDAWCPRNVWPSFTAGPTVLAGWTATILCPRMGGWADECAFILKESAVRSGYLLMSGIAVISWYTNWSLHPSVRWGIAGTPSKKLAPVLWKVSASSYWSGHWLWLFHWLTGCLTDYLTDWFSDWHSNWLISICLFTYLLAYRKTDLATTWLTGWST